MPQTPPNADRRAQASAFLVFTAGISLLAFDQGLYGLVERQRAAVVLSWGLLLAAAVGLLPRSIPRGPGIAVLAGLAGVAAWTAASLSWTVSDEITLTEAARATMYLCVLALVALSLDSGTWRAALGGVLAGGAIVCGIALGSRLTIDASDLLGSEDARRLFQPFGYWNAVGSWASMTSALAIAVSAHTRALPLRVAALGTLPVAGLALGLTYSRAAIGAAVIALAVLILLSRNRWTATAHAGVGLLLTLGLMVFVRGHAEIAEGTGTAGAPAVLLALVVAIFLAGATAALTGRFGMDEVRLPRRAGRIVLVATAVIAVVAVGTSAATVGPRAWDQFQTTAPEPDDPAQRLTNLNTSRYGQWRVAVDQFRDEPARGTGAGTFEYTWNQRGDTSEFVRDAHSFYLEALSELGIPGLLAVLVFLAGLVATVAVAWRSAAGHADRGLIAGGAGVLVVWFVGAAVDWLWESPGVTLMMLSVAGILIACGSRRARGARRVPRLAIVALAGVGLALQLPGLVSGSDVEASKREAERGRTDLARAHATTAIETQPWASTPYVQRALVEEQMLRYAAASADLRRAEQRDPENWRIPLLLARVEARAGHPGAALAAFRRARALRPLGDFVSLR